MVKLFSEKGYKAVTANDIETIKDIKSKFCYLSIDYENELHKNNSEINQTICLPKGRNITIGEERFKCPELLFQPHLDGLECDSLDQAINDSIMKCDNKCLEQLYGNILISGGTSMLEGIAERINKEISRHAPSTMITKAFAEENRQYAAWIGGSFFSYLSTFRRIVMTKDEYQENGPSFCHTKFSFHHHK